MLDVRGDFAEAFVLPALRSGALRDEAFPLADGLGRCMVAARLVDIARMEQAQAVAHGGVKPERSVGPLDEAVRSLDATLEILHTRPDHGASGDGRAAREDMNLWARSVSLRGVSGADTYVLTKPVAACPEEPAFVEIDFERGTPVAVNGIRMPFLELLDSLNAIAGTHGVGRMRSSQPPVLYEAPAAAVLHAAHRQLQAVRTSGSLDRFAQIVAIQYADLVDRGQWFTPLREALDGFVNRVQEHLTGVVRLRLLKGECRLAGAAASRDLLEPLPVRAADLDDHLASGLMFGTEAPADPSTPLPGAGALVTK